MMAFSGDNKINTNNKRGSKMGKIQDYINQFEGIKREWVE